MATMSASAPERLIEAGIELLERDGVEALQARKVAAQIGMSTMAVYTRSPRRPLRASRRR
jgi:AcrR family transcriptional regulator